MPLLMRRSGQRRNISVAEAIAPVPAVISPHNGLYNGRYAATIAFLGGEKKVTVLVSGKSEREAYDQAVSTLALLNSMISARRA